ncbi:MAG: RusA family crossover junction endodeoxyribonuclease [Marivivens sp.]|nr:RusA family crossover junction endodeoxyribonuclease [Marivivens sp.]
MLNLARSTPAVEKQQRHITSAQILSVIAVVDTMRPQTLDALNTFTPIEFFVEGMPIPQGSKSIMRGRLIDSNKKLKPWRKDVGHVVSSIMHTHGLSTIDGPVLLDCVFVFPRPNSHFAKSGLLRSNAPDFYTKKPDLDKLARAIGDACSIDAPLLKDDSQIMKLTCTKRYRIGQEPCGVHIALTVL